MTRYCHQKGQGETSRQETSRQESPHQENKGTKEENQQQVGLEGETAQRL